jgi:hypothetical protein
MGQVGDFNIQDVPNLGILDKKNKLGLGSKYFGLGMSCPSLVEIKQQGVLGNMMGALRSMLGVIGIGEAHT